MQWRCEHQKYVQSEIFFFVVSYFCLWVCFVFTFGCVVVIHAKLIQVV